MEKQQIQDEANEAIDKARAVMADPATPPAHKSVIAIILGVVLKFLPVLIDIFHHASTSPVAAAVLGAPPVGPSGPAVAALPGGNLGADVAGAESVGASGEAGASV